MSAGPQSRSAALRAAAKVVEAAAALFENTDQGRWKAAGLVGCAEDELLQCGSARAEEARRARLEFMSSKAPAEHAGRVAALGAWLAAEAAAL